MCMQISWFVVAPISLILYVGACYIWPLPGLGVQEFINLENNPRLQTIIDGQEPESPEIGKVQKTRDEETAYEISSGSSDKDGNPS
jgi:hypothetical protein